MARWNQGAPNTWNKHLSALTSFTAYCGRQDWLTTDPGRRLERRKPVPGSRPSRLAPDPHLNDAPGTYRRAIQPITTSSPVPTPIPASPSRIHRGVMSSSKRCRSTMRPVRASSLTSVVASSAT